MKIPRSNSGRSGGCGTTTPTPKPRSSKLINCFYNTCLVFNNKGDIIGKYSKMHLFDIDAPGKFTFKESKTLSPGNNICIVEIAGLTKDPFKIGIGICYDIRFSDNSMQGNIE